MHSELSNIGCILDPSGLTACVYVPHAMPHLHTHVRSMYGPHNVSVSVPYFVSLLSQPPP